MVVEDDGRKPGAVVVSKNSNFDGLPLPKCVSVEELCRSHRLFHYRFVRFFSSFAVVRMSGGRHEIRGRT